MIILRRKSFGFWTQFVFDLGGKNDSLLKNVDHSGSAAATQNGVDVIVNDHDNDADYKGGEDVAVTEFSEVKNDENFTQINDVPKLAIKKKVRII